MRVKCSGREAAFFSFLATACFDCNFWKSRSPASLSCWVAYGHLVCKVLGPLSVAGLQISFLMSKTCKKCFFDGAISSTKMSVVLGEKMWCLDYLCCVSKLLRALGMNVSAQECQCVNMAVNKMVRGLINDFLHGQGESQWATQHPGHNCMAWPACLLATSWLLPWLLPEAAASCGHGHAVVCLERSTVILPLALWVSSGWGGPCTACGPW